MRLLLVPLLFFSLMVSAQTEPVHVRAFPITDYITTLNDSTSLIQLYLPDGPVIKEKTLGVLKGVYLGNPTDTGEVGYGRCQLIKGDYYYFAIYHKKKSPKAGDLLYIRAEPVTFYSALLTSIADHAVLFNSVYDEPFYEKNDVYSKWSKEKEEAALDSMVKDIRFTGKHFLEADVSMNVAITKGPYKDQRVLDLMTNCQRKDLIAFLEYMIARPKMYAGRSWKISEIFATWAVEGAPTVVKKP